LYFFDETYSVLFIFFLITPKGSFGLYGRSLPSNDGQDRAVV
jgi:hypothetical protein